MLRKKVILKFHRTYFSWDLFHKISNCALRRLEIDIKYYYLIVGNID